MDQKSISADNYQQDFLSSLLRRKYEKKIKALKDKIKESPENEKQLNLEIMYLEQELEGELKFINKIDEYELEDREDKQKFCQKHLNKKEINLLEFFDSVSSIYGSDNCINEYKNRMERIEKYLNKSYGMSQDEFLFNDTKKIGGFDVPKYLFEFLFEYQREGVEFLQKGDVLLADEMGLGKTLQIISLLACKFMTGKLGKTLIIVPVSVIYQWIKELYSFFPFLRVIVCHNSYEDFQQTSITNNSRNTVVITSYQTFLNSSEDFYIVRYNFLILDEAHKIKNNDTKIFKALNLIDARSRILMTGTPIQNNLKELWCLFNSIRPEILGSRAEFEKNYVIRPSKNEKITQDAKIKLAYIKEMIRPYLLRREKKMLEHELPTKSEKIVLCPMTDYQEILYENELERQRQNYERNLRNGINVDEFAGGNFSGIFRLRRICNHPSLNDNIDADDGNTENNSESKISGLENVTNKKVGKFVVMKFLLKKFAAEKRKTLIFTQTIKMLDLISEHLNEQRIVFERIEGKVTLPQREEAIKNFKDDPECKVMILTTRVGCLGLNLVMASRLIIYDPDWNPSIDRQARERIFRFGQTNDVETYMLLARGTIEEKIYQKQLFKTLLCNDILSEENKKDLLEEMKDLLSYKKLSKSAKNKGIIENVSEEQTEKTEIDGKEMIEFIRYRESRFTNKK